MTLTETAAGTCNGTCPDAREYHTTSGFCDSLEAHTRFEGRCHCGRLYSFPKPDISDEDRAAAKNLLAEAIEAYETLRNLRQTNVGASVGVSIHGVRLNVWAALDLQLNGPGNCKQWGKGVVSRIDFYPEHPR